MAVQENEAHHQYRGGRGQYGGGSMGVGTCYTGLQLWEPSAVNGGAGKPDPSPALLFAYLALNQGGPVEITALISDLIWGRWTCDNAMKTPTCAT